MVAFGPALVLEFVPTKKVDVGDMANAGSQAGKARGWSKGTMGGKVHISSVNH